jgi:hypothetical protein
MELSASLSACDISITMSTPSAFCLKSPLEIVQRLFNTGNGDLKFSDSSFQLSYTLNSAK